MKDMKEMLKGLSKGKESDSKMSEQQIQAKMDVLKELLNMASSRAGEDIVGELRKVSVAAPDKKGLLEGLDKAKEMTENSPLQREKSGIPTPGEDDVEEDASDVMAHPERVEDDLEEELDEEKAKDDEEDDEDEEY